MNKTVSAALFACALPLAVFAQYGAPAPKPLGAVPGSSPATGTATSAAAPADLTDAAAAPPSCKKPIVPGSVRRADDQTEFNEKFAGYQDCIKAYVDSQNKLANLHVNAANKAVEEANAYVGEVNAKLSAPK